MNKTSIVKRAILFGALTVSVLVGLTACAQVKSWVTRPGTIEELRPAQTNFVTVVTTNVVEVAAATNAITGEVTPAHTALEVRTNVTPVIQPAILFTNIALAPIVKTGIGTADTVASAAGIPWAHTVAEILMAGIGVLLTWANSRNKRKLQASIDDHVETQGALAVAQDVGKTLVENFEQLRHVALTIPGYTRDIDDKVMTAVQVAQQIAGVKGEINSLVDEHTNITIPGK